MKKRWHLAAVVPLLALGVWWGTSHDSGPTSQVLGALRVVTVHADSAPGSTSVTAQQAKAIVFQRLSAMQPTVKWNYYMNDAQVDQITHLTQVYDFKTGRLLYQRTAPIDAWVVQLKKSAPTALGIGGVGNYSTVTGFGVVSDNTSDPLCTSHTTNPMCASPGELLAAQAYVKP